MVCMYSHMCVCMCVGWNMGNAPPERSFEQMVPIRGGEYDVIALGLQEATWSVKKTKEESETSAEAQCVRQLLAAVKDILDDDFFMVEHCLCVRSLGEILITG